MKLWEKNYLVAFLSLILVMNICIALLASFSFHNDLKNYTNAAIMEEKGLLYTVKSLYAAQGDGASLNSVLLDYRQNGVETRVYRDGEILASTVREVQREDIKEAGGKAFQIVSENGNQFFRMEEEFSVNKESLNLVFIKDMGTLYQAQQVRICGLLALSLLLCAVFGWILYRVMRNIYRPVENIAHELRTPLTGIRGYGQYLMMAKLSEEDRYFATEQIVSGAKELQNIVEKLLIMGNLREGQLKEEWVDVKQLFSQLKEAYPTVEFVVGFVGDVLQVRGDATLLKSLLSNLISNGVREGEPVVVTALPEGGLRVHNGGTAVGPELLSTMNRNGALPPELIRGSGRGLHLCHEIAKLHEGRLTYSSGAEGTDAWVHFSESRIKLK